MHYRYRAFSSVLSRKIIYLIIASLILGVLWFVVESGFLLVFQGFLVSIGFLESQTIKAPSWYPVGLLANLAILSVYGFARAMVTGLNKMVPSVIFQVFSAEQRKKLLLTSFSNSNIYTTSEIISSFGDLSNKAGYFIQHISSALGLAATLGLLFLFALNLAFYETIIAVFLLFVFMLPFRLLNKRVGRYGEKLVHDWNSANKVLVEGLKNIFLLKVYNQLEVEYHRGVQKIESYEKNFSRYISVSTLCSSFPLFAGLLIIAIVTFVSKNYLITEPIKFVAFLYLFLRFAQTASALSSSLSSAAFFKDAFKKLSEITSQRSPSLYKFIPIIPSQEPKTPVEISFRNVSFSYDMSKKILDGFHFNISPGDFLLIKGPSGAGKSTVIKLLVGMVYPQSGQIFLDGFEPKIFLENYAHYIGYVGPEPFLFPGTLRENLHYGSHLNHNDEDLFSSLEKFSLLEIVKGFQDGLDEYLTEDTQLSTGQKQRLSFARAILRKPRLLILDEATANIDVKTEKFILDYLIKIKGSVTIVAITHRESFNQLADKNLVMESL